MLRRPTITSCVVSVWVHSMRRVAVVIVGKSTYAGMRGGRGLLKILVHWVTEGQRRERAVSGFALPIASQLSPCFSPFHPLPFPPPSATHPPLSFPPSCAPVIESGPQTVLACMGVQREFACLVAVDEPSRQRVGLFLQKEEDRGDERQPQTS